VDGGNAAVDGGGGGVESAVWYEGIEQGVAP
jgi:hypothetical protein